MVGTRRTIPNQQNPAAKVPDRGRKCSRHRSLASRHLRHPGLSFPSSLTSLRTALIHKALAPRQRPEKVPAVGQQVSVAGGGLGHGRIAPWEDLGASASPSAQRGSAEQNLRPHRRLGQGSQCTHVDRGGQCGCVHAAQQSGQEQGWRPRGPSLRAMFLREGRGTK